MGRGSSWSVIVTLVIGAIVFAMAVLILSETTTKTVLQPSDPFYDTRELFITNLETALILGVPGGMGVLGAIYLLLKRGS